MIIALQHWSEDEEQALSLARLIVDIEPSYRGDVVLVLARRRDCPKSTEAVRTEAYCQKKMPVMLLQSARPEVGHPDGCFGLWAGTVGRLHRLWQRGILAWDLGRFVFTCESDGGPIRKDWINRLRSAHGHSLTVGKRVTGSVMDEPMPHVNGNLILDLSVWGDHPCLSHCPSGIAWDCHHATTLLPEARSSLAIWNAYQAKDLTAGVLDAISRETAWVHGVKCNSLINYARRHLVAG
jgi:hypothetical protein